MPPEKLLNFLVSQEFYQLVDKIDEVLQIDPKIDGEKDGKVTFFLDRYFRRRLSGLALRNYAKNVIDFLSDEERDNLLNFIQQNFFDLREKLWQEELIEDIEMVKEVLKIKENLPKKLEEAKLKIPQESKQIAEKAEQILEIKERKKPEETDNLKPVTFEEKEQRYHEIMEPLVKQKSPMYKPEIPEQAKTTEITVTASTTKSTTLSESQEPSAKQESIDLSQNTKKEVKEFKTITFEPQEKPLNLQTSPKLPETTIIIKKKEKKQQDENEDRVLDLSKF